MVFCNNYLRNFQNIKKESLRKIDLTIRIDKKKKRMKKKNYIDYIFLNLYEMDSK